VSAKSSSLFADLQQKETAEVEAMYETVLAQLSATESQLLELYKKKKIHSQTIKFAVNKSAQAPKLDEETQGDLVELALEQKADFDACLARRDALVERLVLPRHRVLHTMRDFYEKLTTPLTPSDSTSLANEMDYFSRFFELQAILEIYTDEQDVQSSLHRARTNLLETVKAVNKNDRRLAQLINQHRSGAKAQRTEAGRLKAYLEKVNAAPVNPVPEPNPEVNERLLAGEALTMEEFASMLEHGGLMELETGNASATKPKQRQKKSMRTSQPRRGQRQTSPRKRD
jgi:DNA-binding protein H-NS